MGFLSSLSFAAPWVLLGLLSLPILYYFLRVTPPAPRLVYFPPAHLLAGLNILEKTPARTPWWILLLRLLMVACIIIAIAGPILNRASGIAHEGAVRIILDNSWPSAQTWRAQQEQALSIIQSAARDKRDIYIMTTAPEGYPTQPLHLGPLTTSAAEAKLKTISPLAWPADYQAMANILNSIKLEDPVQTYWLGHGYQEGNVAPTAQILQEAGKLTYYHPPAALLPIMMKTAKAPKNPSFINVEIDAPPVIGSAIPLQIHALDENRNVITSLNKILEPSQLPQLVEFDISEPMKSKVAMLQIAGRESAATNFIIPTRYASRNIGIVTSQAGSETSPLIDAAHYIKNAIEGKTSISTGSIDELLKGDVQMIIMSDIGSLPNDTISELEDWIKKGGMLVRFAGPNMTQGEQFLTPVPIMQGGRALDGALTWEKPLRLAPFPEKSPLFDIAIDETVTVSRQLLAAPTATLADQSWANLEDGTPLITSSTMGKGLLVMVHTTATPVWSDFVLSGMFVKILERFLSITPSTISSTTKVTNLQPVILLNGFGKWQQPQSNNLSLPATLPDNFKVSAQTPPGVYGRAGVVKVVNLGDHVLNPISMFNLIPSSNSALYGAPLEKNIAPYFMIAALILFLADWIIMLVMQMGLTMPKLNYRWKASLVVLISLMSFNISPSYAQLAKDIEYAANLHLAYIKSGNTQIDEISEKGLTQLSHALYQRTSIEPEAVVGLDVEKDELAFFPLIYWPINSQAKLLSNKAIARIQNYLDHGGMILVDTRDQFDQSSRDGTGANIFMLRRLLGGVNIPPLIQIPETHVLRKSFYLLNEFPGRYDSPVIWIEEQTSTGNDQATSVIIGGNDWASAWAATTTRQGYVIAHNREQEMAIRFGINVMMYALTGNYKADQVHIPYILERLGQ
jgi:hypothetical protein